MITYDDYQDARLGEIVTKLERYEPKTWEDAALLVIDDLKWGQGWLLGGLDAEHLETLYDDGRWTELARAFLRETGSHADDLVKVLAGKQADYGPRNILRFGEMGLAVRLWDKIARYNNLEKQKRTPSNEAVADTMLDIVGYVTISVMLRLGWFTLPLLEEVKAANGKVSV